MIVSVSAKSKLQSLLQPGSSWFRVSVKAGGCNGFEKVFDIVNTVTADDVVIDNQVAVDSVSWDLLRNSELIYQDDLGGSQFVLNIPEAKVNCGCGRSFDF